MDGLSAKLSRSDKYFSFIVQSLFPQNECRLPSIQETVTGWECTRLGLASTYRRRKVSERRFGQHLGKFSLYFLSSVNMNLLSSLRISVLFSHLIFLILLRLLNFILISLVLCRFHHRLTYHNSRVIARLMRTANAVTRRLAATVSQLGSGSGTHVMEGWAYWHK